MRVNDIITTALLKEKISLEKEEKELREKIDANPLGDICRLRIELQERIKKK